MSTTENAIGCGSKLGEVMGLVNDVNTEISDIYETSAEVLDKLRPVLPSPSPETATGKGAECPDKPLVRDLTAIIERLKTYKNGLIQLRDTLNI